LETQDESLIVEKNKGPTYREIHSGIGNDTNGIKSYISFHVFHENRGETFSDCIGRQYIEKRLSIDIFY
jgi:hypothetical protein